MKKIVTVSLIITFCALGAYAAPGGKGRGTVVEKKSAADRIGDEVADSTADILTGEDDDSSPRRSPKGMPPGLEKKGKTPPGWSRGKKKGWEKKGGPETSGTKTDSPIKQFMKKLLGQDKDKS
ncbi:MAG: hypothetical protein GF392_01585 [Candidatus Omnitrophica bacterium]|nr:hypothetical protein [Candidatus Omnitrophota bacterium]